MSQFVTRVVGVAGTWPQIPERWSYSSLTEAEQCPLRWALLRASYPEVWGGRGYPRRPSVSALSGTAVHRGVERIIRALASAGLEGVQDPGASRVLRSLGGLSAIVADVTTSVLVGQEQNPRTVGMLPDIRHRLTEEAPSIRAQLQQILSRIELAAGSRGLVSGDRHEVRPLPTGSFPEQLLESPELGLVGVVDLLLVGSDGVVIIDYKTGGAQAGHWDQARTYAVLWLNDALRNPTLRPVLELRIARPGGSDSMAPTESEIADAALRIAERLSAARLAVGGEPPVPRLDKDHCPMCPVRHLCDDYWTSDLVAKSVGAGRRRPTDITVRILERQSDRSATVATTTTSSAGRSVLTADSEYLEPGQSLRMLGVYAEIDPDTGVQVISAGRFSEIYKTSDTHDATRT